MDLAAVQPFAIRVADREIERSAERDVARGVLVQERVVEDGVQRPDASGLVDQGNLTEPAAAFVALRQCLEQRWFATARGARAR